MRNRDPHVGIGKFMPDTDGDKHKEFTTRSYKEGWKERRYTHHPKWGHLTKMDDEAVTYEGERKPWERVATIGDTVVKYDDQDHLLVKEIFGEPVTGDLWFDNKSHMFTDVKPE